MTPTETSNLIDAQIARNEKALLAAITKLENEIILLTAGIDSKADGTFYAPSRTLPQARAVLAETQLAFDRIYGGAVDDVILSYQELDKAVQDSMNIDVYQAVTVDTLTAQISLDRSYHASLSGQTQDNLSAIFLDHTINGLNKDDLINSIRGALTGSFDSIGKPMATHAKTIAQDGLMGYYQNATNSVARLAGVEKFLYFGSIIATSRQWCRDHVDKEYTIEEIKEFDDDSWAGKKQGSTMTNRGGYACLHFFAPIVE